MGKSLRSAKAGKVRIIGGQWRGRRLTLAQSGQLRPTPDRVRETLFNWLQPVIEGASCLDLFAGSGALGFEALSRGCATATLVERDRAVARLLEEHARLLGATQARVVNQDAHHYLQRCVARFDLVFLDPPFNNSMLAECCALLVEGGWLNRGALVYVESDDDRFAFPGLSVLKRGRAGQVSFALLGQDDNELTGP